MGKRGRDGEEGGGERPREGKMMKQELSGAKPSDIKNKVKRCGRSKQTEPLAASELCYAYGAREIGFT